MNLETKEKILEEFSTSIIKKRFSFEKPIYILNSKDDSEEKDYYFSEEIIEWLKDDYFLDLPSIAKKIKVIFKSEKSKNIITNFSILEELLEEV